MTICRLEYRCHRLGGHYCPYFYTALMQETVSSSKTLILCEYPKGIMWQETVIFCSKSFIQVTGWNYYYVIPLQTLVLLTNKI